MARDAAGLTPAGRRWLAPVGLAVLVAGAFFLRLGQDMPMRHHEALVAETARNMVLDRPVHRDDGSRPSPWLVPNFNGSDRLRKTPLPYWIVAGLSMAAGGVNEWTARLPSAVSAAGTVLVLFFILRWWTDRRTAYLGAAMLATSVGFLISAREAQADMLMTFFTTASLAALWMAVERRWPRTVRLAPPDRRHRRSGHDGQGPRAAAGAGRAVPGGCGGHGRAVAGGAAVTVSPR